MFWSKQRHWLPPAHRSHLITTATDATPECPLRLSLPLCGKMPPVYCPWHLIQRDAHLQYIVRRSLMLLMAHLTAC